MKPFNPEQDRKVPPIYGAGAIYKEPPIGDNQRNGVVPLDTLPAQWWNWLWNNITVYNNEAVNPQLHSITDEITSVLREASMTPDVDTSNQLVTALKKIMGAVAYPIGTLYWTKDKDFQPSVQFGGVWTRIKGKFIYAANSETPGSTGGAREVTLQIANLPSHTHSLSGSSQTLNVTTSGAYTPKGSITFTPSGTCSVTGATYTPSGTCSVTGADYTPSGTCSVTGATYTPSGTCSVTGATYTPSGTCSVTGATYTPSGTISVTGSSGTGGAWSFECRKTDAGNTDSYLIWKGSNTTVTETAEGEANPVDYTRHDYGTWWVSHPGHTHSISVSGTFSGAQATITPSVSFSGTQATITPSVSFSGTQATIKPSVSFSGTQATIKPSVSFSGTQQTVNLAGTAATITTSGTVTYTPAGSISNTGSGAAFSIIPVYETAYCWERTA